MEENFKILGLEVKDAVTGFHGVVTTLSFDLYGCIQVVISPPIDKSGEIKQGQWFDINRIIVINKNPVMERPDFYKGYPSTGKKGASNKSVP